MPVEAALGDTEPAAQIGNIQAVYIVVDQKVGRGVYPVGRG